MNLGVESFIIREYFEGHILKNRSVTFNNITPDQILTHSDMNHAPACHSRERRNLEKHWIPDQVRDDKPSKTYVVMVILPGLRINEMIPTMKRG